MHTVDGRTGHGGGQVLRTAVGLAAALDQPVHITDIRAGRRRPGLMRQHLCGVQAVAELAGGTLEGAVLGATELTYHPAAAPASPVPRELRLDIGSAGGTGLVLQALLPLLLTRREALRVTVTGGTHNDGAPPAEFLQHTLYPLLRRMGAGLSLTLERHGFVPAGGGRVVVEVDPGGLPLRGITLDQCGTVLRRSATILTAHLPKRVGQREKSRLIERLNWPDEAVRVVEVDSDGPGNAVMLRVGMARGSGAQIEEDTGDGAATPALELEEVFTAVGRVNRSAVAVVNAAVEAYRAYRTSSVLVGPHLLDQLLLPAALAASPEEIGGSNSASGFLVAGLSRHARTQVAMLPQWLPVRIDEEAAASGNTLLRVRPL